MVNKNRIRVSRLVRRAVGTGRRVRKRIFEIMWVPSEKR